MQIANILSINYQRMPLWGLFKGCLGVVAFFYHYARYMRIDEYNKLAGKLLDYIINCKNKKVSTSFSDGLYGLGWSIKYMQKYNFMDVEDGALKMFDMMTLQDYSKIEFELDKKSTCSVFSRGLYSSLLPTKSLMEKTFHNVIMIVDDLNSNGVDISFLISILYFLDQYEKLGDDIDKVARIRESIILKIHNTIFFDDYQSRDIFILYFFLHKNNIKMNLPKNEFDLLFDVYMNWETIVYEDTIPLLENIDPNYIDKTLANINFNIPSKMLSLDGICSLGINLIKKQEKYI